MENKSHLYQMVYIGVVTAVICILAPLSIPIGLVPISFTNLAIYFAVYILGMKKSVLSCILYILIGFIGVPVFSQFTGGPAKLLGPTGGYIIGFIFMALVSGFFIDRFFDKWYLCFTGMVLGTIVCYILGTIWLSYQANLSISSALGVGVIPFIPGDLIKIVIATFIGPLIRKQLMKSNMFFNY
ncbi:biotin transporter BioY [Defluviitalea phaphyphila]|uniref:biotin transporter BioY n=1 Tax=Defluviitalea phaphyphila TaxID=1473580 RepID=UPI00073134AD|nr:biotin transporter BioY [Defluviitalea phaphyphila]